MLVSISSVNAQKAGGAPKQEELIGYWKMEKWPTPDVIKVNPWPQPYQWFAFYEDGRMLSMMNSTDGNYTSSDLEEIFSSVEANHPNDWLLSVEIAELAQKMKNEIWNLEYN